MINCGNALGAWQEMSEAFFAHHMLWIRREALVELMPDFSNLPDFAGDRDTIPLM